MKKFFIPLLLAAGMLPVGVDACTNFIVTKGASTDGSVMVSYSADSHTLYGVLYKYNAPKKAPSFIPVYEWESARYLGDIANPAKTYSTTGNMNVHQVVIAETTAGGRKELQDTTGRIDYAGLIYIALQRARTAREAIEVIVSLANEYGYCSTMESFSIADKNEAWIFEFIGKGTKMVDGKNVNKGIVWVARRIPDGYICAHANHPRITQFPKDDPENCMYAPDVISFARENGLYEGTDEDFSFSDTYAPLDFSAMRACEARVWSFFRRHADGMDEYLDYAMGRDASRRMPLWVKPTEKISPKQLFDDMRDHYEGTPLDMTADIGAGGNALPYRWRPMEFEWEGRRYVNERATATQQTAFWFVSQSRDWLPDEVGGLLWFGVDDAATSALTPIYASTTKVPESLREGNGHMTEYSPTAAFWIVNRVAQFAYLRYNVIGAAVREVVDEWENEKLEEVARIDELAQRKPSKAVRIVTDYSVETAQELFDKWVALDRYLMVKYKDGNNMREDADGFMDNGEGRNIPADPEWPGYTDMWKQQVVEQAGNTLRVPSHGE